MRAVVPVTDGGKVVALVSVGITVNRIEGELAAALVPIAISAASVLAVGLAGAWLISRRLQRQTHGMGEAEITRMYEYYSAVLHAVREGLFLLDDQDRVQLVNDEARRLLDLPDDVVGRSIHDLGLPPGLVQAAIGDTAEADDIYLTEDHVLVVSASPATWAGREVGAVVTLRDHTDLQAVTGELDVVRGLTESLRSQNHEAANRLHTVVSLIEMGRTEEAVDFATEELQVAQLLTDRVVGAVDDPVLAALLLGKTAEAAERGHRAHRDRRGHRAHPGRRAAGPGHRGRATSSTTPWTPWSAGPSGGSRSGSTAPTAGSRSPSATAVPACPPRTATACSSAAGPPRPAAAAGSASPWSPRWRDATAARSTSAPRRTAARSSRWRSAPPTGGRPS